MIFDDARISKMGDDALGWWIANKPVIMAIMDSLKLNVDN
jgi:hypothetical protein